MHPHDSSFRPLPRDLAAAILKSRQKATQETQKWKRKAEELTSQVHVLSNAVQELSRQQRCRHHDVSEVDPQPTKLPSAPVPAVLITDASTIGRGDAFLDNLRYYLIAQDRSPKDVVDLLGRNHLDVVCTFLLEYARCLQGPRRFASHDHLYKALNSLEQCTAAICPVPEDISSADTLEKFCRGMLCIALFKKDASLWEKAEPASDPLLCNSSSCLRPSPGHPTHPIPGVQGEPHVSQTAQDPPSDSPEASATGGPPTAAMDANPIAPGLSLPAISRRALCSPSAGEQTGDVSPSDSGNVNQMDPVRASVSGTPGDGVTSSTSEEQLLQHVQNCIPVVREALGRLLRNEASSLILFQVAAEHLLHSTRVLEVKCNSEVGIMEAFTLEDFVLGEAAHVMLGLLQGSLPWLPLWLQGSCVSRLQAAVQDVLAAFKLSESRVASTLPMFAAYLREVCGSLLEGLETLAGPQGQDRSGACAAQQTQGMCGQIVQVMDCHVRMHEE
eukprot:jgi/Botrbrau1/20600/Bobra.113_1s0026.1